MNNKLRDKLLDENEDIWEIIDVYKTGFPQDDLYELLRNQKDNQYGFLRNRVLFILDELPYSININWKELIPHISKGNFNEDFDSLSQSSLYALNAVWGRIPTDCYFEKAVCLKSIDYDDNALVDMLLTLLFIEVKKKPDFFEHLIPNCAEVEYSFNLGLRLFLNKKQENETLKRYLDCKDSILKFYTVLFVVLYQSDNKMLLPMLPEYSIKGVRLINLHQYDFNERKKRFRKK